MRLETGGVKTLGGFTSLPEASRVNLTNRPPLEIMPTDDLFQIINKKTGGPEHIRLKNEDKNSRPSKIDPSLLAGLAIFGAEVVDAQYKVFTIGDTHSENDERLPKLAIVVSVSHNKSEKQIEFDVSPDGFSLSRLNPTTPETGSFPLDPTSEASLVRIADANALEISRVILDKEFRY